jgi:RNA polymerase sigma-70 factor, ECF subfamily
MPDDQDTNRQGLAAGDHNALAALWTEHRERLLRLVRFRLDPRLPRRVDPEDVLQESFVAARERIAHFAKDGFQSPFVWLRLIVLQCVADSHRHHLDAQMRAAGRERSMDAAPHSDASAALAIRLSAGGISPSGIMMASERRELVQQAIATLTEGDREILALRHGEHLGNNEVAEVLGIAVKAASIRYIRALKRLQTAITTRGGLTTEVRHVR